MGQWKCIMEDRNILTIDEHLINQKVQRFVKSFNKMADEELKKFEKLAQIGGM